MAQMDKRVPLENQVDQARTVFQDNPAKMVQTENLDRLVLMVNRVILDLLDHKDQRVTEERRDQQGKQDNQAQKAQLGLREKLVPQD